MLWIQKTLSRTKICPSLDLDPSSFTRLYDQFKKKVRNGFLRPIYSRKYGIFFSSSRVRLNFVRQSSLLSYF